VAYSSIRGTRPVTSDETKPKFAPCPRCGVVRRADGGADKGKKRTGLCRDCHNTLTPVERARWAR
jgi:hypothetical protein